MPKYDVSSGLPDLPPGLSDKEFNLVAPLYRAINSLASKVAALTGNVQYSADELLIVNPYSYTALDKTNRLIVTAGESVTYGQMVRLTSAGTPTVMLATAGSAPSVHGCINTPGTTTVGNKCEIVFMQGICAGVSGTTVGQQYWLSATTPGVLQSTQPTGVYAQAVGWGLGAAGFYLASAPRETYMHVLTPTPTPPALPPGALGIRVTNSDGTFYDI